MALVIIDMQPFYFRSCLQIIDAVDALAATAVAAGAAVVTVRLPDTPGYCGPTHWKLTQRLGGYSRWREVHKTEDDGSSDVIAACKQAGFDLQEIEICGLYANLCVQKTALGLAEQLPEARLTVVQHACVVQPSAASVWNWSHFITRPNLRLL
jgi:nicotinamidase-related amidase